MTTISATAAREKLYDLIEEVSLSGKRIGITKKGETKAVLISPEELASWEATIDVMSDPDLVKSIIKSEKEMKTGKYKTWEDIKKELGLDVSSKIYKPSRKGSQKNR